MRKVKDLIVELFVFGVGYIAYMDHAFKRAVGDGLRMNLALPAGGHLMGVNIIRAPYSSRSAWEDEAKRQS